MSEDKFIPHSALNFRQWQHYLIHECREKLGTCLFACRGLTHGPGNFALESICVLLNTAFKTRSFLVITKHYDSEVLPRCFPLRIKFTFRTFQHASFVGRASVGYCLLLEFRVSLHMCRNSYRICIITNENMLTFLLINNKMLPLEAVKRENIS